MPVKYLDLEPLRKDTRYPFRLTDKEGKKWVIPASSKLVDKIKI